MHRKEPLLRMIILLIVFILLLMFVSIRLGNQKIKSTMEPIRSKYFLWQDGYKAFYLLKNSITFTDSTFSAFSKSADSIMSFKANYRQIDSLKEVFKINQ